MCCKAADDLSVLCPPLSPLLLPGPHFVAVNNKNEIVVTDFHNHSVKVWSVASMCTFLTVFICIGSIVNNGLQKKNYTSNNEAFQCCDKLPPVSSSANVCGFICLSPVFSFYSVVAGLEMK